GRSLLHRDNIRWACAVRILALSCASNMTSMAGSFDKRTSRLSEARKRGAKRNRLTTTVAWTGRSSSERLIASPAWTRCPRSRPSAIERGGDCELSHEHVGNKISRLHSRLLTVFETRTRENRSKNSWLGD